MEQTLHVDQAQAPAAQLDHHTSPLGSPTSVHFTPDTYVRTLTTGDMGTSRAMNLKVALVLGAPVP